MTDSSHAFHILCNGAKPKGRCRKNQKKVVLEWRDGQTTPRNMTLGLTKFVERVVHLPARLLDLLEIAAYVFCADRMCSRGRREQVEFHSWARSMELHVKVRDHEFWNDEGVRHALKEALCWMTGDADWAFRFYPGHQTPQAHLFDMDGCEEDFPGHARVLLFSGGLDSLAGAVELLEKTQDKVCLVSHRSQTGTVKTQNKLFEALQRKYPNRVIPYPFVCTLSKIKAPEESQRTRAFLYCSIALAVSSALSETEFSVFENGVTALNIPKRRDMVNARASRTAHPKTLALLKKLYSLLTERPIGLEAPFMFKTKTEAFEVLRSNGCADLINSSTSCSRTYQTSGNATHCGGCSQCIDRRFAAFASGCESQDEGGIYAFDFIQDSVTDGETKMVLIDFIRQAKDFAEWTVDRFERKMLDPLADVVDSVNMNDPSEAVLKIFELCHRHGLSVRKAIKRMDELYREPFREPPPDSLLCLIGRYEHLRPPVELLAERICTDLARTLPIAFKKNQPKDENDLNDKIQAYLDPKAQEFEREYPVLKFGLAKVTPDHSLSSLDLLIEVKFVRDKTTPSKASEGIAADLTKYPKDSFKLFIVYDPHRAIIDDSSFARAFEEKGLCKVHMIR